MKNLLFSSISATFINSSLYYSKALCKPYYCVPFTWSFCSLHLSFTATLSSIFSHRLCPVSLILYFSSAKTSHIHLSKLNNGRGVTLVGGSQLQVCPSPQAIPMKCSWAGTGGSSGVTFSRWFQCSACFEAGESMT